MTAFLARILSTAVFWSYIITILRFGGILFVLPLVLRTVRSEELGFYYVFQSLTIVSVLLDLGISPSVSRAAGYAWVGSQSLIKQDKNSLCVGPNWDLLGRLLKIARVFYRLIGIILFCILCFGFSFYVWKLSNDLNDPIHIRLIWLTLCVGAAWNLSASTWPVILAGINKVREQQISQLVAIAGGYAITVIGLLAGVGLWALALSSILQALILRLLARGHCRRVLGPIWQSKAPLDKELFRIIWPMSWRSGLIGITYTLYLSAPIFFISALYPMSIVAEVGLAVQLGMIAVQIATVPFLVKVPLFSILHAQQDLESLRRIFTERLLVYLGIFMIGSLMILCFARWGLQSIIHSKTQLPSGAAMVLVLIFLGVEGLQALFRALCVAMGTLDFWKYYIGGSVIALLVAFFFARYDIPTFFAALIAAKLIFVDISVILFSCRSIRPFARVSSCD